MKNKYEVKTDYVVIYTTKNEEIYIDKEDLSKVSVNRTWFLHPRGYACCKIKGTRVFMHHLILGRHEDKVVDHINGNTRDNRKCNLRHCSQQQNSYNKKTFKNSKTRGVTYQPKNGINKWVARIQIEGESIYLGAFPTKEEAMRIRRTAEKIYYKGFARGDDYLD